MRRLRILISEGAGLTSWMVAGQLALAGAVLGLACGPGSRPVAPQDPPPASASAAQMPAAVASSSLVAASASASGSGPAPALQPGPVASRVVGGTTVALPKEPWFLDKPERYDDCGVAGNQPASHFPAPFETCDSREESWSSPPGSHHLHFHYRRFSVSVTTERRKSNPGACCYAIWEFPNRHRQ